MGFISFNENYYRRKLEEYENKILSDAEIREAKQLHITSTLLPCFVIS